MSKVKLPKGSMPLGTMIKFAGTVAPAGWVFAKGQALSSASYPDLFAVIGYTYGGSGSSFNVVDMTGRIPVGRDNMGVGALGSITSAANGSNGQTLGEAVGVQEVGLVHAHSGPHSHSGQLVSAALGTHSHTMDTADNGAESRGNVGRNGYYRNSSPSLYTFTTHASPATHTHNLTVSYAGGGSTASPHTNVQPTRMVNYIIKAVK